LKGKYWRHAAGAGEQVGEVGAALRDYKGQHKGSEEGFRRHAKMKIKTLKITWLKKNNIKHDMN